MKFNLMLYNIESFKAEVMEINDQVEVQLSMDGNFEAPPDNL